MTAEKDFLCPHRRAKGLFEIGGETWNSSVIFFEITKSTCDFLFKTHFYRPDSIFLPLSAPVCRVV